MAIRCSVLGHAWGDPEVERERESRGSEAVVTAREFRTCKRCGDRDVLGEVTEVKPAEDVPADATEADVTDAAGVAEVVDDAEIIDEERTGHADGTRSEADDDGPEDDGVILEADEVADPGPAEWPDPGRPDEDDVDYEPRPWPDAEPPDPAERGPRDPDPFEAVGPSGDRREGDGEPIDPAEVLSEAASDQDADPAGGETGGELPLENVEVFCPSCGFVDESPTPSLRGGDSCPACRTSYLEERDSRE